MNFNIIDGDRNYLQKTEQFAEEYNRNYLSTPKLCEKLNITRNEYRKLRKHCIEENLIKLKRKPNKRKKTYKTHPRHYGRTTTKGKTYWKVHYKNKYICNCKTEQQAQEIVKRLKKVDWDLRYLNSIKEEVMETI